MARTIKVSVPDDRVDGCKLVPLHKRLRHWPKPQENVLEGTYYRVAVDNPKTLRAMVTIMPDGLFVAWDMCGKCHTVVSQCQCTTGLYHSASIGWIRATYDHPEWPSQRFYDYAEYFDPYMKQGERPSTDVSPYVYKPREERVVQHRRKAVPEVAPPVDDKDALSVKEIENIDMAELQKQAKKTAKATTRKVRSAIKRKR